MKKIDWGPALVEIFIYFVLFGWALQVWISAAVIGCILAANYHTVVKRPDETYIPHDDKEKEKLLSGEVLRDKNGKFIFAEQVIEKLPFESRRAYKNRCRELEYKREQYSKLRKIDEAQKKLYVKKRKYTVVVTMFFKTPDGKWVTNLFDPELHFDGKTPPETWVLNTKDYYEMYPIFVKDLMVLDDQQRLEYGIDQETYKQLLEKRSQAIMEERKQYPDWKDWYWEQHARVYIPEDQDPLSKTLDEMAYADSLTNPLEREFTDIDFARLAVLDQIEKQEKEQEKR